ncbi:DUF2273 domain-containing protein [Psychrilyobacter sp.]|uniref:DUF2273 domain-containing protein n=1 Tax=Psychrilyobacter sp. TaxID=2586924 RepID=UPI0030166CB3
MLEELIEKFAINSKKYIGGLMGFAFGYIFITHGILSMIVVMLTTLLGAVLGDKENIKKLKNILINRLKEE